MIKKYSTYNTVNEKLLEKENFTIRQLSDHWRTLDQILMDTGRKTKDKMIKFKPFQGEKFIKIIVKSVYYKRFLKEDYKTLGNYWFFIDKDDKEHQININGLITTYTKVNEFDPWGEEDWDD